MSVGSKDADPSFPFKNPGWSHWPILPWPFFPRSLWVQCGNSNFPSGLGLALQGSCVVSWSCWSIDLLQLPWFWWLSRRVMFLVVGVFLVLWDTLCVWMSGIPPYGRWNICGSTYAPLCHWERGWSYLCPLHRGPWMVGWLWLFELVEWSCFPHFWASWVTPHFGRIPLLCWAIVPTSS